MRFVLAATAALVLTTTAADAQPVGRRHCAPSRERRTPPSYVLSHGLRATSPTGKYLGRYQFDLDSWARAGGHGDPRDASWLEQAYRAVRWRQMVGTGAWPVCGH